MTSRIDYDKKLIIIIVILTAIGTTIMFSASSPFAVQFGSNLFFLKRHIIALIIGMGSLIYLSIFNYRQFQILAPWIIVLAILTVLAGFYFNSSNGPARWLLYSNGKKMITTSDFMKFGMIIFTAFYLTKYRKDLDDFLKITLPYFVLAGFTVFTILIQPDLSTSLAIAVILGLMLFIGGVKMSHLLYAAGSAFVLVMLSVLRNPYQRTRVLSWLNPNSNISTTNWQSYNAKIALGNGGIIGTGIGDSSMKHGYLPEAHTDFIYSVIGEELGILFSMLILILFALLFIRAVKISQNAPDPFGMFLALGIGINIAVYACINVAYVSGLLPTTGLPLPFISYGGTHTVCTLASMGILLNISHEGNKKLKKRYAR